MHLSPCYSLLNRSSHFQLAKKMIPTTKIISNGNKLNITTQIVDLYPHSQGLQNQVFPMKMFILTPHHEIHTSYNSRYLPPKTEKEFTQQVKEAFTESVKVISIPSNQKTIKYICELYFNDGSKVVRLICSSNNLYWCLVQGNDLTLAPLFFDTVKITK